MKKSTILLSLILFFSIAVIYFYKSYNNTSNNNLLLSTKYENLNNKKSLAIMLEDDYGNYNEVNDAWPDPNIYVLNSKLSACVNGSEISYDNNIVNIISTSQDYCYIYFEFVPPRNLTEACRGGGKINDCILRMYNKNPNTDETKLLFHDRAGKLTNGAQDDSYRYSGSYDEVNNFICFGSGSESYNQKKTNICPETNKYRIIGAFLNGDKYLAKVIKNDYLTPDELEMSIYEITTKGNDYKGQQENVYGFQWDTNNSNKWVDSALYKALNTDQNSFLNKNYSLNIASTNWQVQGMTYSESYTAKDYYNRELGGLVDSNLLTENPNLMAKIGLMYVSEYGYAASQEYWDVPLYKYHDNNVYQHDWMYNGIYEWSISRYSATTLMSFSVFTEGHVNYGSYVFDKIGVRPTFSLTDDTQIIGDLSTDGSSSHPFRIA